MARTSRRTSFPVGLRGSVETNLMLSGILYQVRSRFALPINSPRTTSGSASSPSTTNAHSAETPASSRVAQTAASRTAGWVMSRFSISVGWTLVPATISISSARPWTRTYPSSSTVAASPVRYQESPARRGGSLPRVTPSPIDGPATSSIRRDRLAQLVDDAHSVRCQRPSDGELPVVRRPVRDEDLPDLRRTEDVEQPLANKLPHTTLHRRRQHLAGADRQPQPGEHFVTRMAQQSRVEAGLRIEHRHAVLSDQRQCQLLRWPNRAEHSSATAKERNEHRITQAIGEEQPRHRQAHIRRAGLDDRTDCLIEDLRVTVGVDTEFRIAGRARSEQRERRRVRRAFDVWQLRRVRSELARRDQRVGKRAGKVRLTHHRVWLGDLGRAPQLAGVQVRVDGCGHDAGAQRPKQRADEVDAVRKREEDPVADTKTSAGEYGCGTARTIEDIPIPVGLRIREIRRPVQPTVRRCDRLKLLDNVSCGRPVPILSARDLVACHRAPTFCRQIPSISTSRSGRHTFVLR